jgi:ABC-type transport system involved in cytochrome c biogenesis permease subunit
MQGALLWLATSELPVVFKSGWMLLHVGFAGLSLGALLLAAVFAAAWLVKARSPAALARLPGPERLDLHAHQFTLVSFLFLGVMLVTGALWTQESSGRYWDGDPFDASALVTWGSLAFVLHLRVLHRWSGRRMAWLTLAALGFAVVTLFVVAILVPAIHDSYMVGG